MDITKDILALYPKEDKTAMTDPMNDLMVRAFAVAWSHMEEAFLALHGQLPALVHKHVPPAQAGVFFTAIFQVMCTYQQEMDNMVLSQMILPAQVMPNIWGVRQGMIEGLSPLGPPTCPASWPASLVEWINGEPTKRAMPVPPTTLAKPDKGKSFPGSSVKRSSQPKPISNYWKDPERKKDDEESQRWEEEKHHRKSSGAPILSLAEHKEPVSFLTSKTTLSRVSQPAGHPSQSVAIAPDIGKDWDKVRRPSPDGFDSSEGQKLKAGPHLSG